MAEAFKDHLRLNARQRSKLLCRLDEAPVPDSYDDRRKTQRWVYRATDVAVCVVHPGGGQSRCLVYSRNISAGGLSFLHGGFLHSGSECTVLLMRRDGSPLAIAATVRHCRHVEGNCHEIGARFKRDIDPHSVLRSTDLAQGDEFQDGSLRIPTLRGRVLVVDESPADRRLLAHQLTATGLEVAVAETTGAALDGVKRHGFEIVILGLDRSSSAATYLIRNLRAIPFRGQIILITADNDSAALAEAHKLGANEILGRPYDPIYLMNLIGDWMRQPVLENSILSRFDEEPGLAELIIDYIEHTRRQVANLRAHLGEGELQRIRSICLELSGSGSNYGFDPLGLAARDALMKIDVTRSLEESIPAIERMISICDRLRCTRGVRPARATPPGAA